MASFMASRFSSVMARILPLLAGVDPTFLGFWDLEAAPEGSGMQLRS
jgi:hypothetical protein